MRPEPTPSTLGAALPAAVVRQRARSPNLTPTSHRAMRGGTAAPCHVRRPGVRPVRRLRRRRGRHDAGPVARRSAEKRREHAGAARADHVARRAARGLRRRAGMDRLPLRRLLADPARRQDVHLDGLRHVHRHGDGPHDPGHGRPRAPQPPQPGRPRVPREGAGPLGARVHRARSSTSRSTASRRRRGRPGAPADLRVPRPRDRTPARPARGGLPAVPALVGSS